MTAIDACIVLAFAGYAVVTGLRTRRAASRSLESYFLAGRTLRGWQAGISMAATQFAADTPLLVTGLVATAGIFSLWRLWIYALAFLLLGFVLAPCWRRARVLTDAELAELRYGGRAAAWLRGIKAVYFGTVFNCTVLAMVLLAAVEIAEPFLLWNQWLPSSVFEPVARLVEWLGIPLSRVGNGETDADVWTRSTSNLISLGLLLAVTLFYSTTGGLRSVVRTDLVQFGVMLLASAGYAVWILNELGGMQGVYERLGELTAAGVVGGMTRDELLAFTPSRARARDASFVVMAVYALQWLVQMNADGTGYLAQRTMACRSDADARNASLVFTVTQVLLRSLLWLPIALGLLVLFPPDPGLASESLRADREASFVRGMLSLPPGLQGLMLTAMLAALASTIDTHLNWGASYWTRDLYQRFVVRAGSAEPSARSLVRVARLSNLIIVVISLAIMTQLSSIQRAWQLSLLLGAGMGVMLVARWLWWRITASGEIAAILASLVLAPLLIAWLPAEKEALRLLLLAIGATGAGIATSLALGPEAPSTLRRFYQRVRPPGFWQPQARSCGEPPRAAILRLTLGLGATLLCALSLFTALVGLGSWLAGSPAPSWLPNRPLWIGLLLASSVALCPAWWALARRQQAAED